MSSLRLAAPVIAGLTLAVLLLSVARAAAAPSAAWVEMTDAGSEVRLVTDAAVCPPVIVDGVARPMAERAGPNAAFANRVCAAPLRKGDRAVTADGASLRAPVARPGRLVILGDSGCRMKGGRFQGCNDPALWPFARIAALAAARRPDLVIHLGDYYYRENACPAWATGCAGNPYGDRWPTWKAEVFDPAAPLLSAAPWVFARGNHETCKRGGAGWFRLLDAGATADRCSKQSATFAVDLGGLLLWVVDSAETDDFLPTADGTEAFSAAIDPVLRSRGRGPGWLVLHRPVWNAARLGGLVGDGLVNATERRALKGRDLSGVDLILSGHVHNFASLSFAGKRPPQLVDGSGGDVLDMDDAPPPTSGSAIIDGLKADIFTMGRFGYFVFDRRGADWVGRFYDLDDRPAAACVLHRRNLACRAVPGVRADPRRRPAG